MRLSNSIIAPLALLPTVANGFHTAGRQPVSTTHTTSTSLEARRSLFPILRRRSDLFFPDSSIDRVFQEMDEMMESSLISLSRPSPSLLGRDNIMSRRRPLGFEVTEEEKEYKIAVHVPDVDANDINLQLDNDGRVLRLKGDRSREAGGMKVQSRFEKAILLGPDVDTSKLAANMSGDSLTIVAPKIEKKEALEKTESTKIEIKIGESKTAKLKDIVENETTESKKKVPTRLAIENMKKEEPVEEAKYSDVQAGKKWPARDFPY